MGGLFGDSITIYGNTMAVGAPDDALVYIFEYSNGLWSEKFILEDNENLNSKFGSAVAMDDKVLIVGAEGRIFVTIK